MASVAALVIGAGQAGLAVSWHLRDRGIDHVVVERGRVAERWRSERWDSLRTLTPNWMARLPGLDDVGPDPDGFATMPEVVDRFAGWARSFDAPVIDDTAVRRVAPAGDGFEVDTSTGRWRTGAVVVATGWCDRPAVPALARALPRRVQQLTPSSYRRPERVMGERVLVVGASASGVQIARELARAGREVTLAVGRHRRLPRRHRGRDVMCWLDRLGTLDRRPVDAAARHRLLDEPSVQLAAGDTVDLATLAAEGVVVTGRLAAITGRRAWFADDLAATTSDAQERLVRLLDEIDRAADALGVPATDVDADAGRPVELPPPPASRSLDPGGVDAVVWATGFARAYPWLHVDALDRAGEIRHDGGTTPVPGLFVAGMRFQSCRRSTFIDGARLDAPVVADAVARRLRRPVAA
jgi:putative flavoprotein involved in K+ transport